MAILLSMEEQIIVSYEVYYGVFMEHDVIYFRNEDEWWFYEYRPWCSQEFCVFV